jgi:hypothetical protein
LHMQATRVASEKGSGHFLEGSFGKDFAAEQAILPSEQSWGVE